MKIKFELTFQDNRRINEVTGIASEGENSIRIWYYDNGTLQNESHLIDNIFSIRLHEDTEKIINEYNFSEKEKTMELTKDNYDEWVKVTNLLFQKISWDEEGTYCDVNTKEDWTRDYLGYTPKEYYGEELSYL